ncbi:MAG TPA: lycopene cyclase [Flavobacterium sp.]|nr:lycopene cyclase [Flavobacterium sp.]
MQHYNYIFTGSGLAALLTVYEMIVEQTIANKTLLLIDIDSKKTNDRTWCFWDTNNPNDNPKNQFYNSIISKKWEDTLFANATLHKKLDILPYHYKMLKGLDVYTFVFNEISKHHNIYFLQDEVINFKDLETHCWVQTKKNEYRCDKVFNSIYKPHFATNQNKYPLLQQHFIGWFIKTKEPTFNENAATFMDFSVEQKENTRFMYVLPTSKHEALIEYTLFSKNLLAKEAYELEIENYIKKLGIKQYQIVEKEQGNIPMTCYPFWKHNTKNTIHIGSAGGWTKASTGFTFKNAIKKSKLLTRFLKKESDFTKFHKKNKFWWYDLIFLDVLYKKNELGSTIFSALFQDKNSSLIFKFLDEETTYFEDLIILAKCPRIIFTKAVLSRIFMVFK